MESGFSVTEWLFSHELIPKTMINRRKAPLFAYSKTGSLCTSQRPCAFVQLAQALDLCLGFAYAIFLR